MPTLSMFYGLVVYMYAKDDQKHHIPHIHVEYQDEEAVFSISEGKLLEGKLPNKKIQLVKGVDNNQSGRSYGKLEFGNKGKCFIQNQTINLIYYEPKSGRCKT